MNSVIGGSTANLLYYKPRIVRFCNIKLFLQHTSKHCNTLQHTSRVVGGYIVGGSTANLLYCKSRISRLCSIDISTGKLVCVCVCVRVCVRERERAREEERLNNINISNNTLQHTAAHCSTLQHTATHCNTLQHTATHCNTLQHTTISISRTFPSAC